MADVEIGSQGHKMGCETGLRTSRPREAGDDADTGQTQLWESPSHPGCETISGGCIHSSIHSFLLYPLKTADDNFHVIWERPLQTLYTDQATDQTADY